MASLVSVSRRVINRLLNGSGGGLLPAAYSFATGLPAGTVLASPLDPYGSGSDMTVVGTPPAQLTLSNGKVQTTSTAAVAGSSYAIRLRWVRSSGDALTEAVYTFTAVPPASPGTEVVGGVGQLLVQSVATAPGLSFTGGVGAINVGN